MTTTHTNEPLFVAGTGLLASLAENWWLLLLRGLFAIGFGALTFFFPGLTLMTLTLLWGAYAFFDGVFSLGVGLFGSRREAGSRWWLAVVGIIGIAAGVLTFIWPGSTTVALLIFIACWSIVVGVMQTIGAIQLRKEIDGEWLLGLSGLLSIAFGALMLMQPAAGALAVVWLIGIYAIVAGCMYVTLAFRVKSYARV